MNRSGGGGLLPILVVVLLLMFVGCWDRNSAIGAQAPTQIKKGGGRDGNSQEPVLRRDGDRTVRPGNEGN
jgi:hypothetical protein